MEWDLCNGHELYEVREKTDRMLQLARQKSRPTVLEIITYRYRGHSVADPDSTYRTKDEIENYRRTKDPLTLIHDTLVAEGVLTAELAKEIDTAARAEADRAAESPKRARSRPSRTSSRTSIGGRQPGAQEVTGPDRL